MTSFLFDTGLPLVDRKAAYARMVAGEKAEAENEVRAAVACVIRAHMPAYRTTGELPTPQTLVGVRR